MLIGGKRGSIVAVVVGVVRLDETIVGQFTRFAILQELIVSSEELGLMLQKVHDLHGGTGLIEVVKLGGAASVLQPFVDALPLRIEHGHIHTAEGCAVVCEGAVADRRAGNGGKPAIKDDEVQRK